MPITIPVTGTAGSTFNSASPVSSTAIAVQSGDLLTVSIAFRDDITTGTVTPSTSGTGTTGAWTLIQDANSGGCRVVSWWARATATGNTTVSVAWDSGNSHTWGMFWATHRGADAGATPIGSSSKGSGASSVSYTITPAGSGSAMWLVAADSAGTGTATITAGTNCTIVQGQQTIDTHASCMIAPTTNPRTDSSQFTLAETHTGSGVSWVGFEVKAASGGGGSTPKRSMLLGVG